MVLAVCEHRLKTTLKEREKIPEPGGGSATAIPLSQKGFTVEFTPGPLDLVFLSLSRSPFSKHSYLAEVTTPY